MSSTNTTLAQALITFTNFYSQTHFEKVGHLPLIEHDEDWISPCESGSHNEEFCYWQPTAVKDEKAKSNPGDALSFENVEKALNLNLHSDIKTYYTTLYSSEVEAKCDEGKLSLLFAWNKDDFERLQENIIGHILMKQRLKQAETVFFAVTDEEDMILSIDNTTGEVWVEQVGCKPHKKLSNSMVDFISQLTPNISG